MVLVLIWKNNKEKWNIYKKPFCFNEDENIDKIISKKSCNLLIGISELYVQIK